MMAKSRSNPESPFPRAADMANAGISIAEDL
jgi:hypothetical protein